MNWTTAIISTNGEAAETHWAEFDADETWNGFIACPWLDPHAVVEMLDMLGTDPEYGISYEFEPDGVLVLTEHQWRDEAQQRGETYEPERLHPDENGLYSLGAYSWVWTEASDEWANPGKIAQLERLTSTYHGIVKAECLSCRHVVRAACGGQTTLELWNDLGGECPHCGGTKTKWTLKDGHVRETDSANDIV